MTTATSQESGPTSSSKMVADLTCRLEHSTKDVSVKQKSNPASSSKMVAELMCWLEHSTEDDSVKQKSNPASSSKMVVELGCRLEQSTEDNSVQQERGSQAHAGDAPGSNPRHNRQSSHLSELQRELPLEESDRGRHGTSKLETGYRSLMSYDLPVQESNRFASGKVLVGHLECRVMWRHRCAHTGHRDTVPVQAKDYSNAELVS